MTISTLAFEQKIGDKFYEAYWLNNGLYWILENTASIPTASQKKKRRKSDLLDIFRDYLSHSETKTGSIHILPSELKQIVANGEFSGVLQRRPAMFGANGRVTAWSNHELITVEYYEEDMCGPSTDKISLPRYAWRKIYEACHKQATATARSWGRMIEPLVGDSNFGENRQLDEPHDFTASWEAMAQLREEMAKMTPEEHREYWRSSLERVKVGAAST